MNNLAAGGQWMNDSSSDRCLSCAKSFDMFVWRHHCRRCGGLFCESCSLRKLHIPEAMLVSVTCAYLFIKPDISAYNRCCNGCAIIVESHNSLQQLGAHHSDSVPTNGRGAVSESVGVINTEESHTVSASSSLPLPPTISCHLEKNETLPNTASSSAVSITRSALREVACEEWKGGAMGGGKHKSYTISAPSHLSSDRKFVVSLDDRLMTVILPVDIMPGELISVKAPSPTTSIRRAVATTVQTHSKKEGLISCLACSFDNPTELLNCQMCRAPVSFDPFRTLLPATTVLEMSAEDVPKKYVIQVPPGVRPDDVFAVVLDLRSFSVICPLDAEGGDNISVTAPAPAPALSSLQGTSDFNADEPVLVTAISSASEAVKAAGPLGKEDNGVLTSGHGGSSLVPMPSSDLSNAKDLDSGSIPLISNEQLPASITAKAPTAEKRTTDAAVSSSNEFTEIDTNSKSVPGAGLETTSESKFGDTARGCKATKSDIGTTECRDAIVSDRHEVYEACATIINNSSCDTHLLGFGKSSGLTAAVDSAHTLDASSTAMCERNSEGSGLGDKAGCALCTCTLKRVSSPDDVKVKESGSSGALCLCSVCGDDPRCNDLPPIAVRIPLATPSMTVVSSIREMEAPPIITLQCRPLHSHAVPSRCDGRSDVSDGNGSYCREERDWENGPVEDVPRSPGSRFDPGTEGRSRVAPAIASLYDPSETSSPVDSFASSSYPTGRDCLDFERTMSVRHSHSHSCSFTQHHDNITQQDEDVTDIAIVVAEQWVACVHCAGDNPPYAHRCEVCFGSLTGTS